MKIITGCLLALSIIVLIGCSKEDSAPQEEDSKEPPADETPNAEEPAGEVQNKVYFTYQKSNWADNEWIILYDHDGNLLDYKKLGDEEEIVFDAPADKQPEHITATKVKIYEGGDFPSSYIDTYTDLEPGSIWRRNDYLGPSPSKTGGKFDFVVDSIVGRIRGYTYSASSGMYSAEEIITPPFSGGAFEALGNPIIENQDYIFSIYDYQGNNRYAIVENPEDGEVFRYNYSEMHTYDSQLKIDIPGEAYIYSWTYGFSESNPNYHYPRFQMSGFIGRATDSVKVGYIDKFAHYATYASINLGDYQYGFSQVGDKPEKITVPPKPAFSLLNPTVYNFEFESDRSFMRKKVIWRYIPENSPVITTWTIFSPGGESQHVPQLPEEVTEKYPSLFLDKLELQSVALFMQGQSQQECFEIQEGHIQQKELVTESFVFTDF